MEGIIFLCGPFPISCRIFRWLGLVGEFISFCYFFLERVHYDLYFFHIFTFFTLLFWHEYELSCQDDEDN